jgi:hypothetical protein
MMFRSRKLVATLVLGMIAIAHLTQAAPRDAGSKLRGNFDRFDEPTYYRTFAAPAPQANRAFSFEPQQAAPQTAAPHHAAPDCAKKQPAAPSQAAAEQAAKQPAGSQYAQRSYSYEPSYAAPRARSFGSPTWQRGMRDASSKLRADY